MVVNLTFSVNNEGARTPKWQDQEWERIELGHGFNRKVKPEVSRSFHLKSFELPRVKLPSNHTFVNPPSTPKPEPVQAIVWHSKLSHKMSCFYLCLLECSLSGKLTTIRSLPWDFHILRKPDLSNGEAACWERFWSAPSRSGHSHLMHMWVKKSSWMSSSIKPSMNLTPAALDCNHMKDFKSHASKSSQSQT